MKKSIVIVCEYILIPDRIGGMDRFFVAYDSALKEKGYDVTWFFKNTEDFDYYKNLEVISAENTDIESFFLNYCTEKNQRYDIVVTHFLSPVSSFFKKVKSQSAAYIISVDHNSRPINGFPFKKRLKNKLKGLLYGKYIDKLVGVSAYTKRCIIDDFGIPVKNKTVVVYNGIDTEIFDKQLSNRESTPIKLLIVSYLRESKGIQDLFEAMCQMDKKDIKNIHVDIYGVGPFKGRLMELYEKYNLQDTIIFKGNSPNMNKLYSQYNYLVLPTYMECFNLSILESLASNVPVITTNVGGNLEVIENNINGFVFEPKNVEKLTEILTEIVNNRAQIKNEVNSRIEEEFSLEIMVNNHLKLLECI